MSVLPPNARRIAEESGEKIVDEYNRIGLICYREEVKVGDSGQVMIREGYLKKGFLPNGKMIVTKVQTGLITKEYAENNN